MPLGENIARIRKQKQLTQPDLAKRAKVSKSGLFMLESGDNTNPTLEVLLRIAEALDTTIAELIDEPKVTHLDIAPEIPDSLRKFARQKKRSGKAINESDLLSLARMEFRGQRPESVDDWAYVYEFLKRSFPGNQDA